MSWPSLPSDEDGLYRWIAGLTTVYLLANYLIRWRHDRQLFSQKSYSIMLPKLFDAGTFSASVMLLLGVLDDDVLRAIGSTKPFLLVAGFVGILYGLHALVPRDQD